MFDLSEAVSEVYEPPVWISSVDHMDQFLKILTDSSLFTRFLGLYRLPEGFPYLRMWFFPFLRVPIIYFANGRLTISPDGIHFEATPRFLFGSSVVNLRLELNFKIAKDEIDSVTPFMIDDKQISIPAIRYYNFPWTRIRTSSTGITSDFLVGLGGTGPSMHRIRQRNQQFLSTMMSYRDN